MTRPRLVKISRWLVTGALFGRPRLLWVVIGMVTAPLTKRVMRAELERIWLDLSHRVRAMMQSELM